MRAYAGLALALSGAPGASSALARGLSSDAKSPAEVSRAAALGLGLAGGEGAQGILVGILEGAGGDEVAQGDGYWVLGAAVQGLGLLGDASLVERLGPLTADASWARRAFAVAALGYLVERVPARRVAPRLSEVFRHSDHRLSLSVVRAVQGAL